MEYIRLGGIVMSLSLMRMDTLESSLLWDGSLGTSWTNLGVVDCSGSNYIKLEITFVAGSATGFSIYIESSIDGVRYYRECDQYQHDGATVNDGETVYRPNVRTYNGGDISMRMDILEAMRYIRIYGKSLGASSTFTVHVVSGWA